MSLPESCSRRQNAIVPLAIDGFVCSTKKAG
jgi:hypothetical protein